MKILPPNITFNRILEEKYYLTRKKQLQRAITAF